MADEKSGVTVGVLKLNDWLDYQLRLWEEWAAERDASWLDLETSNPAFPTLGTFFAHAFTPLQRYSSRITSSQQVDDAEINKSDWAVLCAWARMCLDHHRAACRQLSPAEAEEIFDFKTRSAGTFQVPVNLCLTHAATHCVWHLGGIAHLLRSKGIAPPARLDLIFFVAEFSGT